MNVTLRARISCIFLVPGQQNRISKVSLDERVHCCCRTNKDDDLGTGESCSMSFMLTVEREEEEIDPTEL